MILQLDEQRSILRDLRYSKLLEFKDFGDRLNYLSLANRGYQSPREISNKFYKSRMWRDLREEVIARDMGYDLGVPGVEIEGPPLVHHMIPLIEDDIIQWREEIILNPDLLITTSYGTHNIIHYGQTSEPSLVFIERCPGDTKLW